MAVLGGFSLRYYNTACYVITLHKMGLKKSLPEFSGSGGTHRPLNRHLESETLCVARVNFAASRGRDKRDRMQAVLLINVGLTAGDDFVVSRTETPTPEVRAVLVDLVVRFDSSHFSGSFSRW